VKEQGPFDQLWEDAAPAKAPTATVAVDKDGEEIADFVFNAQNWPEDTAFVWDMGFMVDDNNEPAPENVPADGAPPVNGEALFEGQKWGWDGIDCRAILQGSMYNGPTFANEWSPNGKPFIDLFLHLLPCYFIEVTIVKATSNVLLTVNAVRTTLGELLRYIRMMLLMLCYMKLPDYFWKMATRTGNELEDEANNIPPFTFNWYMSRRHFLAIISALWFTLKQPSSFRDKFWKIWD
jgi:hypothetical protein